MITGPEAIAVRDDRSNDCTSAVAIGRDPPFRSAASRRVAAASASATARGAAGAAILVLDWLFVIVADTSDTGETLRRGKRIPAAIRLPAAAPASIAAANTKATSPIGVTEAAA